MSVEDHHYSITSGERLLTIGINTEINGQTIDGSIKIITAGKSDWEYRMIQLDKHLEPGSEPEWQSATEDMERNTRSKVFNLHIEEFKKPVYLGIQLRAKRSSDAPIAAMIRVEGPLVVMVDSLEQFRTRYRNGNALPDFKYRAPTYSADASTANFVASDDIVDYRTGDGTPPAEGESKPAASTPPAEGESKPAAGSEKTTKKEEDKSKKDDKAKTDTTTKTAAKPAEGFSMISVFLLVAITSALVYFFAHSKDRKKNLEKMGIVTSKGLRRLSRLTYNNNRT